MSVLCLSILHVTARDKEVGGGLPRSIFIKSEDAACSWFNISLSNLCVTACDREEGASAEDSLRAD